MGVEGDAVDDGGDESCVGDDRALFTEADANRTALYRVITLSDRKSRLFIGDRVRIVEERTETWPLQRDDDQSTVTWARTVMTSVATEHARHPLPAIVAGVNRTARDVAKASNIDTIGIIRGNHDRTSWVDLHNQAWPLVCDWLRTDNQRALDHLDTTRGANRYGGGINEVRELAHDARVDLLVLEKPTLTRRDSTTGTSSLRSTSKPRRDRRRDRRTDRARPHEQGRVPIVPDGKLADHERLAAVLRL